VFCTIDGFAIDVKAVIEQVFVTFVAFETFKVPDFVPIFFALLRGHTFAAKTTGREKGLFTLNTLDLTLRKDALFLS
jgi:hypothetical protein